MHVHILGICGTFMGGIALIARELGHQVTGSDANVYPPMSTQLEAAGIELTEGYDGDYLQRSPDLVIVGNAMSRGNEAIEALLDSQQPYTSGPQWLSEQLLQSRWVLAVAGTHGKTTTSSMLAYILEHAGLAPGFLIGGVTRDFGVSARLGDTPFFVIEADEYDTAFFDKRSKFVHYRPRTLVLNNLEYDHADIFPDLAAIQRQFHHLVRTVPRTGLLLRPAQDPALDTVLEMGNWTPVTHFGLSDEGASLQARLLVADGSRFEVSLGEQRIEVNWAQLGSHNVRNALAAIGAARHAGVPIERSCAALAQFVGVRRRLELRGQVQGVSVYDDFAHHPTAIELTLEAMRARIGDAPLIAVLEPRSNTMRLGVHADRLGRSLHAADSALIYRPADLEWDIGEQLRSCKNCQVVTELDVLVEKTLAASTPGSSIVVMSNGSFGGIHQRLLEGLAH